MKKMSKTFFSQNRAEAFAKSLNRKTIITAALDAFNQKQYRVEWYI